MNSIPEIVLKNCDKFLSKPVLYYKSETEFKSISWVNLKLEIIKYSYLLSKILNLKQNDKIAIISENRPEWLLFDIAAQCIGAIPVPLYTSSTDEQFLYILKKSKSKILVVSKKTYLLKVLNLIDDLKELETIICIDDFEYTPIKNINVVFLLELIKASYDKDWESELLGNIKQIKPSDTSTIVFTSGTSAEPKGVVLSHGNIISNVIAASLEFKISSDDKFFSVLPLSHIYERTCGQFLPLIVGCTIGYGQSLAKFSENLLEVKPSICLVVPRLVEKIYERIHKNSLSKNFIKKSVFNFAINTLKNKNSLYFHINYFLSDILVFRKIRRIFGTNFRFMMAGGAAINTKHQKFFIDIGVYILEGYGMTETSPVIAVPHPDDYKIGSVGKVLNNIELKISDESEILVKGPSVMKSYFEDESSTKEMFTEYGYLKTGDLGYIDSDGFLFIKGRLKEIIVTSNGKNIYPVSIENKFEEMKYVEQVCLVGDNKSYLSALIVPSFENLKIYAKKYKIVYTNNLDLINNIKIQDLIHKCISQVNENLAPYEKVKRYKLLDTPFSEETGELTSTLKLKRRVVLEKYKDLISLL